MLSLERISELAVRPAAELTRRDVARGLLAVPASDALDSLPDLRRALTAAGNPLSALFWEHAERLLVAVRDQAATVGDVRTWLEATGAEPAALLPGWFSWPDEADRGPVAREMHAQLVEYLEGLVAAGEIDPDRLLAGDRQALDAYVKLQDTWLNTPLPDGREPIWAVADEEDDAFSAAWDQAEGDAREFLEAQLAGLPPRPCPVDELQAVCRPLREKLPDAAWPYDLLAAAGGVDPAALPDDDAELWLTLAAGVVSCVGEPPDRGPSGVEQDAAWFALGHGDWIAAVVSLAREGPGASADEAHLAEQVADFDFGDDDDAPLDDDDLPVLEMGFQTVTLLWEALGAVDDGRLTALGWWGLPEAALRAWRR